MAFPEKAKVLGRVVDEILGRRKEMVASWLDAVPWGGDVTDVRFFLRVIELGAAMAAASLVPGFFY